jgi:hypothetical protein
MSMRSFWRAFEVSPGENRRPSRLRTRQWPTVQPRPGLALKSAMPLSLAQACCLGVTFAVIKTL